MQNIKYYGTMFKEGEDMNEIIKMFRKGFPYINRDEQTILKILNNKNNTFIEKRDEQNKLIAVSVINKNTILFFYVDEMHRNNGIGSDLLVQSEKLIKNNGYKNVVIGAGFDYLMPGVPTSKRYFDSVNENLSKEVNNIASDFFEKRGYFHSWDCNCFDMNLKLNNFDKFEHSINDTINNIKYRWANLTDLKQIIDCADDACQYQDEKFSKYYKDKKLYQSISNQRVLVAEKQNKIVGCIIIAIEMESKDLGNVGCTCVRFSETHQGIGSNMVILGTRFLHDIGLKNASLGYTYSGLDKMYGNAGYKISCYYMMANKKLN